MFELTKYANGQQTTLDLHRLRIEHEKLYAIYNTIPPKVKPALIADLLSREIDYYHSGGRNAPMYTAEVFTKKGTDSEEAKMYIIQKTGMVPAIHDHGTHYVTSKLALVYIIVFLNL